jgi:hypothetical protein
MLLKHQGAGVRRAHDGAVLLFRRKSHCNLLWVKELRRQVLWRW